ncbi:MAG: cytochrome c biogenesis protein ResB [Clostridia bacterium]|nr:cytochrome c biogenesis protein ResB [Clostridia bacterium]
MKKIGKFLSSMPFAIILLVLLAAACALSSTVSQGQTYEYYAAQYGERMAGLILALRLDDAFHSWWFIGLSTVLCINLFCCNLIRLPALMKRAEAFAKPDGMTTGITAEAAGDGDPHRLFAALHMPKAKEDGDGRIFAAGNKAGFWGAWICHLGILLLILGFALGQMTMKQYTVYALPGQTKEMGDSGLSVTVEDLRISRDENGAILQYTAMLTVSDSVKNTVESGRAAVNAPANLYGYKFFQNSIGWGADVRVLKNGEELQKEQLCVGEFFAVADKPELVICFPAFYPDYSAEIKTNDPAAEVKDPAYIYQVYYQGQILGMNALKAGEELTIDEYTVLFERPRNYTLLAVKRDSFTWLVLLGGLITLAGLVLAFWLQPSAVCAVREGSGWHVYGRCRKGGVLFRDEFLKAAAEAGFTPCENRTTAGGDT